MHHQSILSLFTRICGLSASWYFIDLSSESLLSSIVAPALVVVFLISLMLWLVMFFHRRGINQHTAPGSSGNDFSTDGGE